MLEALLLIGIGWTGLSFATLVAGSVLMTRYKRLKYSTSAEPSQLQAVDTPQRRLSPAWRPGLSGDGPGA